MDESSQQTMDAQDATAASVVLCCRFCGAPLRHTFVDLGMSPLCESFIHPEQVEQMEAFYPLHVRICEECYLVQLPAYVRPEEIFTEYAYFSSYSDSWLEHTRCYVEMMIERFELGVGSFVVEVGSNDGYLLHYLVKANIPILGIEPARNVAEAAVSRGVRTMVAFFGAELAGRIASEERQADLIVVNNVLAQAPNLNDFVTGLERLLAPRGVVTLEFPHLVRLIEGNQYDTIYHEHFSYFSFLSASRILGAHGLAVFDVEELPTHGGSLRVYAGHSDIDSRSVSARVTELEEHEETLGFSTLRAYSSFQERVEESKRALLAFLIDAKRNGKAVAGYGAPGKANTLLNYCGIRTDFLDYTVDRNPYKHGLALPGTRIPVFSPEKLAETRPDYILILPWNLKNEIVEQISYAREWGARFVVPIPGVEVMS